MKPLPLDALAELLRGPAFGAWREEHRGAAAAVRDARARAEDLEARAGAAHALAELTQQRAAEALAAVGAAEDEAARLAAEAQQVEDRAAEALAAFEAQRERVSELWLRLGGAERATDQRRERVEEARARASGAAPRSAAHVDLADEEGFLLRAGRAELSLDETYRREAAVKQERWGEVEALWSRSLELALLVAELGEERRRCHAEAERLFAEAEERGVGAGRLGRERDAARAALDGARAAVREVLARARSLFGCAPGERFLYFGVVGDAKQAFAVALGDGAPAEPLSIHRVTREHGVARLAPVRSPSG